MHLEDAQTLGCYITLNEEEKQTLCKAIEYTKANISYGNELGQLIDIIDNTNFVPVGLKDDFDESVEPYFPPIDKLHEEIQLSSEGQKVLLEGESGTILNGLVDAVIDDLIYRVGNQENEITKPNRACLARIQQVFFENNVNRRRQFFNTLNKE